MKEISYTYSLFKGNHYMESRIIEYETILLDKCKVEQTELISRLIFTFFLQIRRTFHQIEHLHFPGKFSYFFHGYDMMSLGNIYPITF